MPGVITLISAEDLQSRDSRNRKHGEALGPSGENFESRRSVKGNIGHFTPLFENDKN